jgi:hypothetical protein
VPFGLAVTHGAVYFTTNTGYSQDQSPAPLADGAVKALLSPDNGIEITKGKFPRLVATDDQYVYWTDLGSLQSTNTWDLDCDEVGAIYRAPLGGGEPSVVVSGQRCPHGIAVDSAWIYWTTWHEDGRVMKIEKP